MYCSRRWPNGHGKYANAKAKAEDDVIAEGDVPEGQDEVKDVVPGTQSAVPVLAVV